MEEATKLYHLRTFPAFPKYHELSTPDISPTTQRKLLADAQLPTIAATEDKDHDAGPEHSYTRTLPGSSLQHKEMMEAARPLRDKRSRSSSPQGEEKSSNDIAPKSKLISSPPTIVTADGNDCTAPSTNSEDNSTPRTLSCQKSNVISTLIKKGYRKIHRYRWEVLDGSSAELHCSREGPRHLRDVCSLGDDTIQPSAQGLRCPSTDT